MIYESLTGNTREAGRLIAAELTSAGVESVACPTTEVDLQALSEADLVIVGSWTCSWWASGQAASAGW